MSRRGHTCDRTSIAQCPICGPLAQRAGIAVLQPPPLKPPLPSLQTTYPEEGARQQLWQAAEQHGWVPDMHWFPKPPYAGLWCEFIRGTDVLRVLVHRAEKSVTRDQQLWLDTLSATGKFEVYVCEVGTLETVLIRIAQKDN